MDTLSPHADNGNIALKRCRTCPEPEENRWHPATPEYFGRDKSRVDGLSYQCKRCKSEESKTRRKEHPETQKRYYTAHREEKLQYAAQYRSEHKEEKKQYNTIYQEEHREEIRLQRVTRYSENREEFIRRNAKNYAQHSEARRQYASHYRTEHSGQVQQYRETHRTEHRLYDRRYHQEHREQKSRSSVIYRQEHREELKAHRRWYSQTEHGRAVHRASTHRRKARKRAIEGTYTSAQIAEQLKRQHYRCYYAACGFSKFRRIKENGQWKYLYEVEHTFPLVRVVGTTIPANDMGYIVLACPSCNSKKRDKFPWEWFDGGRLL